MAWPTPERLNPVLWDVLRYGRASAYAAWLDIDWEAQGGKILLPVLGKPLREAVADGEVVVDRDAGLVRYYDHEFPMAQGTLTLDEQHYRLAHWRTGNDELNYRRFFDIATLMGVRVELPDVFEATHRTLLDLPGPVDGWRIDHPDGLADPGGYLDDLAAASPDTWVVVEKILGGKETLPRSWKCAGTTGYDALNMITAVLIDEPEGGPDLDVDTFPFDGFDDAKRLDRAAVTGRRGGPRGPRAARPPRRAGCRSELQKPADRGRAVPGGHAGLSGVPGGSGRGRGGGRGSPQKRQQGHPARVPGSPARPRGRLGGGSRAGVGPSDADHRPGDGEGNRGHRVLSRSRSAGAQGGRQRSLRQLGGHLGDVLARVLCPVGCRLAGHDDDTVDPRHEAFRGRASATGCPARAPGRVAGSDPRMERAGEERAGQSAPVVHLAEPRCGLADRAGSVRGLPGQGRSRGQGAHQLDRAELDVRGPGQPLHRGDRTPTTS